jgi:hypothetical protein
MTFRRDALLAVGGFDVYFTSAGDDVDICWKLLRRRRADRVRPRGQVRHHRRNTVRGYLRQQRNYGGPSGWSRPGTRTASTGWDRQWAGSIYGGLRMLPAVLRPIVYHGSIGSAPYQSVLRQRGGAVLAWWGALLPLLPLLACWRC